MPNKQMTETTTPIAEFRDFEAQMLEFRQRYDGVVYDLTVPAQEKQARSDRFQIGKVISALDKAHASIKAPLLEKTRQLDGARKALKDDLLQIQGKIKAQIAAHEAKLQAKADAIQAEIDKITVLAEIDDTTTSDIIKERLNALRAIDPEDDIFDTRKADAALTHRQALGSLQIAFGKRAAYEAEQAELAKLRAEEETRKQKERDERIRREAAERAKREAEERARQEVEEALRREKAAQEQQQQAEVAAKLAAERAEREAKEAALRAAEEARMAEERRWKQQEAERLRKEAEAKAKAEAERLEAERQAKDEAHREQVEREAMADFMKVDFSSINAAALVNAIKAGKIRHVSINY